MTDDRGQRTEVKYRGQRTDDRGQKSEVNRNME